MPSGPSGANEKFLTPEFVIPRVYEIMNPLLKFVDMFPKVRSTARVIAYKQEQTSDANDANKQLPRRLTTRSQFTYVTINQMEIKSAVLNKKGFAIAIDQDALDFTEGVDEIERAIRKLSFWLAQDYDTQVFNAITASGTSLSSTWNPTTVWSDPNATPVADLEELEDLMIREGYPYRLTDVFLYKDNFKEFKKYLTSLDIGDFKQQSIYGVPNNGNRDSLDVPVIGTTVHRLLSGITDGGIIGIDRNNPGMTIYYNQSPRYSTMTGAYETMQDGARVRKPYSFGFNFNRYTDQETHEEILQFWYDIAPVVHEPYAILVGTSKV